jgi:GDPmannose 4,6-dehydratase
MKRALITGITGQDGSYLAELLLEKQYEVHGIIHHPIADTPEYELARIRGILDRIECHHASITDYDDLLAVTAYVRPDECYHLAAHTFVGYSAEEEFAAIDVNIAGTHKLLRSLRETSPDCKCFFAGSSEMFGNVESSPQNEQTSFHPRSIYGISKLTGYHMMRRLREASGIFAATGILYNHESPRRGKEFVTRKITSTAARIKLGKADKLVLGNVDARRDWGHARDYVSAMWLMMQHDHADDFVIASGATHTVREFMEEAFACVGLDPYAYLTVDPNLFRPNESVVLSGDTSKIRSILGWESRTPFKAMVREMVENDLQLESGEQ